MSSFRNDILPLKDKLFRLALRITMQREDAEDVVQDTMIKLWGKREALETVDNLEAFAMTICRNKALDHVRRAAAGTVSLDDRMTLNEGSINPYDSIYAQESLRHVNSLMQQLPEKQRACMHLRDFEGKNYREIADIMEMTEDQVKINIFRARKAIKSKIRSNRQ
ncbi:MAG: sigma-70 family RNA polymerase sigma factor [Bacteroidales bacterium]|nr:sigma-70 family RNA polymerase sigma factor [Bacteroidales bacterium]MCM1146805.1 sigma-70 family RNA polymerase sigma factor [Bacteroidales bacterium]MCM1205697.1 sigma-70 family RNA polymerase sigma factor [Bacillota bacterium]MCM1510774.1 sigma-70 family RNA polymerase sigma factor [Clostridium sp.]